MSKSKPFGKRRTGGSAHREKSPYVVFAIIGAVTTGSPLGLRLIKYLSSEILDLGKTDPLSQCLLECSQCGNLIVTIDEVYWTPGGQLICKTCARESYIDVPIA